MLGWGQSEKTAHSLASRTHQNLFNNPHSSGKGWKISSQKCSHIHLNLANNEVWSRTVSISRFLFISCLRLYTENQKSEAGLMTEKPARNLLNRLHRPWANNKTKISLDFRLSLKWLVGFPKHCKIISTVSEWVMRDSLCHLTMMFEPQGFRELIKDLYESKWARTMWWKSSSLQK